jgi:hypothetical protein
MGDYDNRSRPVLELIGSLAGRSCGVNIMAGSGGIDGLTDQDIAGAVAMARQYKAHDKPGKRAEAPLATCVRPELLLLHWGGRSDFVPLVARKCSDAIARTRDDPRMVRAASLLAAQLLAGRQIDAELSSWLLNTTKAELEREIGFAVAWMRGELSEAESAYCNAMRRIVESIADQPRSVGRFALVNKKLKLVMVPGLTSAQT